MSAIEKYNQRAEKVNSLLCVGLDPDIEGSQFEFNKRIIDQTHEYASAYKLNTAFYEARGDRGWVEMKQTFDYLAKHYSDILTICDAKRADIASTSVHYAKAIFDWLEADAVTLNPYLSRDALQPFLNYKNKGCIILCRTSNPGASEFQDLLVEGKPLWQIVAEKASKEWNEYGNCMLVVGAAYPENLKTIREIVGNMPLLVPGIGSQGGDIKTVVQTGINSQGLGLIINAGRSIVFTDNPAQAALALRDEINTWRQ